MYTSPTHQLAFFSQIITRWPTQQYYCRIILPSSLTVSDNDRWLRTFVQRVRLSPTGSATPLDRNTRKERKPTTFAPPVPPSLTRTVLGDNPESFRTSAPSYRRYHGQVVQVQRIRRSRRSAHRVGGTCQAQGRCRSKYPSVLGHPIHRGGGAWRA